MRFPSGPARWHAAGVTPHAGVPDEILWPLRRPFPWGRIRGRQLGHGSRLCGVCNCGTVNRSSGRWSVGGGRGQSDDWSGDGRSGVLSNILRVQCCLCDFMNRRNCSSELRLRWPDASIVTETKHGPVLVAFSGHARLHHAHDYAPSLKG